MPYAYKGRPWDSLDLEYKVSTIVRRLGQVVAGDVKNVIKDIIDGKINLTYDDWLWIVNMKFKDEQIKRVFTEWIIRAWFRGYDLNKNKAFLKYFLVFATLQFSIKTMDFSELVQLSMMGNLEFEGAYSSKEKWEDEINW